MKSGPARKALKSMEDIKKPKTALSMKKAAVLLSLLSGFRIGIGLFCSVLVAMAFGASIETDAYNIGTYLPMVLMCFFGLDLMRAILTSTFSKLDVDKKEEPSEVFSSVITVLATISLVVIGIGVTFARFLVRIIAPGVTEATVELAVNITRIMMPAISLMMLGAIVSAVLLAYHEYAKSQIFEILLKIVLTAAAIVCVFIPNIYILAFGFLVGELVATLVTLRLVFSLGLRYRPQIRFSPIVKDIVKQSIPVWIGVMAVYAATTVQRRYASTFKAGSIASLTYAETIFSAVATMVSVPLFQALSPRVARNVALGEYDEEARAFWSCFKQGSCIAVVLTAIIWLYPREIVSVVFKRGAFDLQAVDISSSLFTWIGVGVWGNIMSYQAIAILFAHNKSHFSMLISIISSAALCLVIVLAIDYCGIKAIGMGYGVSQTLRGLIGLWMVSYLLGYRFCNTGWWLIRFAATSLVAVAAIGGYSLLRPSGTADLWTDFVGLIGAFAVVTGGFIVAGYLFRLEQVVWFVNWAKSFLWGKTC